MKRKNNGLVYMTASRFFLDRLAVTGLGILLFLFLFSFLGGLLTPYGQDQVFYRQQLHKKDYAAVTENESFRLTPAPGQTEDPVLAAQAALAAARGQTQLEWEGKTYRLVPHSDFLFDLYLEEQLAGILHKDLVLADISPDFFLESSILMAYATGQSQFSVGEKTYRLENGVVYDGQTQIAYVGRLVIRAKSGQEIPPLLQERIAQAVTQGADRFSWEGQDFLTEYDSANRLWAVKEYTQTQVWDDYASPSAAHWLGTDKNGMDVLTRLMYGGRVSLAIGFAVVLLSAALGVVFGGIAGYFGGFADEVIMRLVDVFYCVPSTPILIILGAAMDGLRLDPRLRLVLMMLVLGLLEWPAIARLVRGQLLYLREQEFMTAAEALGLKAGRRIFRHLIPNVIPQLIVICTMSLGSTILTEATLSFLGLGVKFPFASWGNIMNDVVNVHVLTSYPLVWIPAGICLMLAVLGFHFIGDGLRSAFDPKTKR